MSSVDRGKGPKDIFKKSLQNSQRFLEILESMNDPTINRLVRPTNRNIDEILDYIDKLPEGKFIPLLKRIESYL